MKKITIFIIALLAVTISYAQNKKNIIKTNPLSLAVTNLNLSYERFLSEKISIQLHGAYLLGYANSAAKLNGLTATPEVRFYLTNNDRPKGFYLGPFGRYESYTFVDKSDNTEATLTRIGGGLVAGYQFKLGNTVTWDIFGGPKYMSNTVSGSNTVDLGAFDGSFGFRFGTTFGVAF